MLADIGEMAADGDPGKPPEAGNHCNAGGFRANHEIEVVLWKKELEEREKIQGIHCNQIGADQIAETARTRIDKRTQCQAYPNSISRITGHLCRSIAMKGHAGEQQTSEDDSGRRHFRSWRKSCFIAGLLDSPHHGQGRSKASAACFQP